MPSTLGDKYSLQFQSEGRYQGPPLPLREQLRYRSDAGGVHRSTSQIAQFSNPIRSIREVITSPISFDLLTAKVFRSGLSKWDLGISWKSGSQHHGFFLHLCFPHSNIAIWVKYNDLTVLPHWNHGQKGKSSPFMALIQVSELSWIYMIFTSGNYIQLPVLGRFVATTAEVGQRNYLFFFGFTSHLVAEQLVHSCVSWRYLCVHRSNSHVPFHTPW